MMSIYTSIPKPFIGDVPCTQSYSNNSIIAALSYLVAAELLP